MTVNTFRARTITLQLSASDFKDMIGAKFKKTGHVTLTTLHVLALGSRVGWTPARHNERTNDPGNAH